MNLINGVIGDTICVTDRGLSYGDGVFRTLTMRGAQPVLWRRQYAKLAADCKALRLPCPAAILLERDMAEISTHEPDCVIKIIITRGSGPRGYAIPGTVSAQRIVASAPLPDYPRNYYEVGVQARICDTRLALQPMLAGIKHLNRLEHVLARSEWSDAGIAEGLMLDASNNMICGTMSNLFAVKANELMTPDLAQCGVAGVMRDLTLELARTHGIRADISHLSKSDVLGADELFVLNSVIGVWQIVALEGRTWRKGLMTARVRSWLSNAQK